MEGPWPSTQSSRQHVQLWLSTSAESSGLVQKPQTQQSNPMGGARRDGAGALKP